jgi:hypothetical protein
LQEIALRFDAYCDAFWCKTQFGSWCSTIYFVHFGVQILALFS